MTFFGGTIGLLYRLSGVVAAFLVIFSSAASAQIVNGARSEQYLPTTWVDPDGCEHWVMDDGAEGYMTPKVTPDGLPVCNGRTGVAPRTCGRLTDQYFATDKYFISSQGRAKLATFFRQNINRSFIIVGHTDSRASDAYNIRLSMNRANAVASVARSVGANIVDIRGMGERQPIATNSTIVGMAQNRRVDILCVQ